LGLVLSDLSGQFVAAFLPLLLCGGERALKFLNLLFEGVTGSVVIRAASSFRLECLEQRHQALTLSVRLL
jgi:hypothetical protein